MPCSAPTIRKHVWEKFQEFLFASHWEPSGLMQYCLFGFFVWLVCLGFLFGFCFFFFCTPSTFIYKSLRDLGKIETFRRIHKNRHNSSLRKLFISSQLGDEESRKASLNEGKQF